MNTNLAQLYLRHSQPSDTTTINQIGDELLAQYQNPNSFFEIISILTDPDVIPILRKSAAVGLKTVIKNHLEFLITNLRSNEQPVLNNILQILSVEEDPHISLLIITSLSPVFKIVRDSWPALTELLSILLTSNDPKHISTGLQLMSDFLPYASTEFVAQHLPTISQFLLLSLSSQSKDILINGLQLFSSLLHTEIPIEQFSETFFMIFQRSLEILHGFLIENDVKQGTKASLAISQMLKSDPLIAPAPQLYQLLFQLLNDVSIPVEARHIPLYPISKLIKHHGSEIQDFFPQSLQIFLLIAALQFEDIEFVNLESPQLISPIFKNMANTVSDPNQFIDFVLQNACQTGNIPESCASIISMLGLADSDCDEIEIYCPRIVMYCLAKIELQNLTLTQGIIKLLYSLIDFQAVAMTQYAGTICNLALQFYQLRSNEDLVFSSIDTIRLIFNQCDLDSSFIIDFLPNLVQAYQTAPPNMRYFFVQCFSSSIVICNEDSVVFADTLLPIVFQGAQQSTDNDTRPYYIEALGDFLAMIPERCQDIYADSINIILSASSDPDFNLCSMGLISLINIIKFSKGDLLIDFTPLAMHSAINALKMKLPESGDIFVEDDSCYTIEEIIVLGFKLLRFLFKYHHETCAVIANGFPSLFKSALCETVDIQVIAIQTAVYFIIYFNPEKTDIYDDLFKIIIESDNENLVIASFNAYQKILAKSVNQLALPNFERFVLASFACLAHQLRFQKGSFEYRENTSQMLSKFIFTLIREQFHAFPGPKFIETVTAIIGNVCDEEAFLILESLADFVENGGFVTDEIIAFGLSKLQLCDFLHGPEPILFIRSIIEKSPQILANKIDEIVTFFLNRLQTEPVSNLKFYWPTMMNIISTVFCLFFSKDVNNAAVKSDECLALVLSKLPVKGDYLQARFIYESIINLIRLKQKAITPFIPEIFRIFVQTLAFSDNKFEKLDLTDDLNKNIINSVNTIIQSYPQLQQQIPEILGNDKIKVDHFVSRLNSLNE